MDADARLQTGGHLAGSIHVRHISDTEKERGEKIGTSNSYRTVITGSDTVFVHGKGFRAYFPFTTGFSFSETEPS